MTDGPCTVFACHAGIQNDRPWNQALLIAKIYSQICHGWRHFPLSWLGLKVAFGGDKCKQDVLTRPPSGALPISSESSGFTEGSSEGGRDGTSPKESQPLACMLPPFPPSLLQCVHTRWEVPGRTEGTVCSWTAPGVPLCTQGPRHSNLSGPPGSDGLGDKEERCAWPRSQAAQLRPVSVLSGGS